MKIRNCLFIFLALQGAVLSQGWGDHPEGITPEENLSQEKREIFLSGWIDWYELKKFISTVHRYEYEGSGAVYLHLEESPKGRVRDGFDNLFSGYQVIRDILETLTVPVIRIGKGNLDFGALFFLATGEKGKRLIHSKSQLSFKDPSFSTSWVEEVSKGQLYEPETTKKEYLRKKEEVLAVLSQKTGVSLDDLRKMMEEGKILTAAEAIRLGFADEILEQ